MRERLRWLPQRTRRTRRANPARAGFYLRVLGVLPGVIRVIPLVAVAAAAAPGATLCTAPPRAFVLDHVRVIDGSGDGPIEDGRVVVQGDRITSVGPADQVVMPADADRIDLTGRTLIPGLIDLHFHIENDPKLALRQLSHGITAFRDPGQWDEKFVELRRMIAADTFQVRASSPRVPTSTANIQPIRPIPSWRAIPTKRDAPLSARLSTAPRPSRFTSGFRSPAPER
jgi:hypothetical protein